MDVVKSVLRIAAINGDLEIVFLIKDIIKCNIEWSEIFRLMFPFASDYDLPLFYTSPTEYLMSYYINYSRNSQLILEKFNNDKMMLDNEMLYPLSQECCIANKCQMMHQNLNAKWKHWITSCYRALLFITKFCNNDTINARSYYKNYCNKKCEINFFTKDMYIMEYQKMMKADKFTYYRLGETNCRYIPICNYILNYYIPSPFVYQDNPDSNQLECRRDILNILKQNIIVRHKLDPNCEIEISKYIIY